MADSEKKRIRRSVEVRAAEIDEKDLVRRINVALAEGM